MCWFGIKSYLKIANEDIPVKKVLKKDINDKLVSPFYNFNWILYKKYSERIIKISYIYTNEICIKEGLHCLDYNIPIIKTHKKIWINGFGRIEHWKNYFVMAEGIIPKNTKYYRNGNGEIVSEALIINSYKPIF